MKHGFEFVGQIHTCGYPVASRKVKDHVESFRQLGTWWPDVCFRFSRLHVVL